jgi:hypothetical protein
MPHSGSYFYQGMQMKKWNVFARLDHLESQLDTLVDVTLRVKFLESNVRSLQNALKHIVNNHIADKEEIELLRKERQRAYARNYYTRRKAEAAKVSKQEQA